MTSGMVVVFGGVFLIGVVGFVFAWVAMDAARDGKRQATQPRDAP